MQSPSTTVVGSNVVQGFPGPLDIGGGKNPSIDFCHSGTDNTSIVIVFQQPAGIYSSIAERTYTFNVGSGNNWLAQNNNMTIWTEPAGGDLYASTNANPNISDRGATAMLVWERKSSISGYSPGINYYIGQFSSLPGFCYYPSGSAVPIAISPKGTITGTTANSVNASVASYYSPYYYAIAWEHDITSTSSYIGCCYLDCSAMDFSCSQEPVQIVSNSSYGLNVRPSIVMLSDGSLRVGWIGSQNGSWDSYYVYALETEPSTSSFSSYGLNLLSISLQTVNDGSAFYGALSRNWSNAWTNYAFKNGGGMQTINTGGSGIQLSNGSSSSNMYVSAFYPFALPYYFLTSQSLSANGLSKTSGNVAMSYGRGVTIGKGNMQFSYSFNNLTVDGNNINFIDAPDSLNYKDLGNVNKVFETQPFSITGQSLFSFDENSGFVDSAVAAKVLGASGSIGCKIELIDNSTGKSIGTIKNMLIQSSNTLSDGLLPYSLSTAGIGSKNVKVRITMSTNLSGASLALEKKYFAVNTATTLQKSSINELTIEGFEVPISYALSQNYPNPFNPSTTIAYQIPKDGRVTIKIFDAIGREVTTLLDEFKPAGYYSAKFDASHLSSGIYFYSIRSGDYNAVKKMALIK